MLFVACTTQDGEGYIEDHDDNAGKYKDLRDSFDMGTSAPDGAS